MVSFDQFWLLLTSASEMQSLKKFPCAFNDPYFDPVRIYYREFIYFQVKEEVQILFTHRTTGIFHRI